MNTKLEAAVGQVGWPAQDLEAVNECPACSSGRREILHDAMDDVVFRCAPGTWTMVSCKDCQTAYLNPRATPSSIGRAYATYYTHKSEEQAERISTLRHIWQAAMNGRLNSKYGLKRQPANPFTGTLLRVVPFVQSFFDPLGRTVDKPPRAGARLLDFGSGDGRFLSFAEEAGWVAEGIDFDPKAVEAARAKGLAVRLGDADTLKQQRGLDAITMSHVIEHVHDPVGILKDIHSALNSGGVLWIETPNIKSFGHSRFGRAWRGLEVPRHLTIFNEASLASALQDAGFTKIQSCPRPFVSLGTYRASRMLRDGRNAYERNSKLGLLSADAILDGIKAIFTPRRSEFLRFRAVK